MAVSRLTRLSLSVAACATTAFSSVAATAQTTPCPPPPPPTTTTCAKTASADFARLTPRSHNMVTLIRGHRLTGAPVMDSLLAPDMNYELCETTGLPNADGALALANAGMRKMWLPMGVDETTAVAHEAFHLYQGRNGLNGVTGGTAELTMGDNAFAVFVLEAAAVAYAHAMFREVGYSHPDVYKAFRDSHRGRGMGDVFDVAHDAAWEANADKSEKQRRIAALAAGGQAVTRTLLNGERSGWKNFYRLQAARTVVARGSTLTGTEPGYVARRNQILHAVTDISPGFSLLPPELTAPESSAHIASMLKKLDFDPASPPALPQRRPAPPAPGCNIPNS